MKTETARTNGTSVLLVIPVHNRRQDLAELLGSLCKLDTGGVELTIAIIDDGSSTPSRPEIDGLYPDLSIRCFRNDVPRGPAFCRNLACRELGSDFIWFLDSDAEIVNPATMLKMVESLDNDPELAGIGGQLEMTGGKLQVLQLDLQPNLLTIARSIDREALTPRRVSVIATCNLMVRRSTFDATGKFNEMLARDEDVDLCLAMRRRKMYFRIEPDTLVLHKLSSAGRDSGQFSSFLDANAYVRDLLRARIYLVCRHRPSRLFILPLLDVVTAIKIFYMVRKKTYLTKRLQKVASASKLAWTFFLIKENLVQYLYGFRLLVEIGFKRSAIKA